MDSPPSAPNPNPSPAFSTAPALPPTTFVQADPQTFRDVVQRLTGAPAGDSPSKLPVTHRPSPVAPRRPAFKLQDRRPSARKLEIKLSPLSRLARSPPYPSPVTPLSPSALPSPADEEDRAIAEKGFFLHPSPRSAASPPELLPLFPLTSPRQLEP